MNNLKEIRFVLRVMYFVHDVYRIEEIPESLKKRLIDNKALNGYWSMSLNLKAALFAICKYKFNELDNSDVDALELNFLHNLSGCFSEKVFLEFLCFETILCIDTQYRSRREKLIDTKFNQIMDVVAGAKIMNRINATTWVNFEYVARDLAEEGYQKLKADELQEKMSKENTKLSQASFPKEKFPDQNSAGIANTKNRAPKLINLGVRLDNLKTSEIMVFGKLNKISECLSDIAENAKFSVDVTKCLANESDRIEEISHTMEIFHERARKLLATESVSESDISSENVPKMRLNENMKYYLREAHSKRLTSEISLKLHPHLIADHKSISGAIINHNLKF